jgi:hypothetical protein
MSLHFGYNCKHFLPLFGKCRKLIDIYGRRKDLAEQRWLKTHEVLAYLDMSNEALLERIASGEIKVRLQKDGVAVFCVSVAWQYDNCFLANGGGQCLYFSAHNGRFISCLMDRDDMEPQEHPNYSPGPTTESKAVEDAVTEIIQRL